MSSKEMCSAMTPGETQCCRKYQNADAWRKIGPSRFRERTIRFFIRNMQSLPFKDGLELEDIPQIEEDKAYSLDYPRKGVRLVFYEDVKREYAK